MRRRCFFNRFLALLLVTAMCLTEAFFVMPAFSESEEKTLIIYKEEYPSDLVTADSGYGLDTLVLPASASGYSITWESSDTDVATVDARGRVHGVLTGEYKGSTEASCYVTARVTWNGKTAEDRIKVKVRDFEPLTISGADPLPENTAEGQMIAVFDSKAANSEIRSVVSGSDASCEQITKTEQGKIALIETEESERLGEIMESLEEEDIVTYVQPNYVYTLESASYPSAGVYIHDIANIKGAWDLLYENGFSSATTVGVVDTGVDADHPDLRQNLVLDENGCFTSYVSGKEVKRTTDPAPLAGHGTHVTGIIGAVYDDDDEVAGVASGKDNDLSRVMTVGFGRDSSSGFTTFDVIGAINVAAREGARVINMSFSGSSRDIVLGRTILNHYYNNGIVFVASAGNLTSAKEKELETTGDYQLYSFPSDMKEVISVCNVDENGARHNTYSGYAKDISAPGTDIYSTMPEGKFGKNSGTSMSAPVISGACALILDANPDLKPYEVRNIICATASDSEDYCRKNEIGYGIVDAGAAVQAAYDAKGNPSDDPLSISIRSSYAGEPVDTFDSGINLERYKVTSTSSVTETLSKPKLLKGKPFKNTIKLSFRRSALITKTAKTTHTEDLYTGEITNSTDTVSARSKSGIKYRISVKDLKTGKTAVYRIRSKTASCARYTVSLGSASMNVRIKGLKRKRRYEIKVLAYKISDEKTLKSVPSRIIKVRVS